MHIPSVKKPGALSTNTSLCLNFFLRQNLLPFVAANILLQLRINDTLLYKIFLRLGQKALTLPKSYFK